jgi:hypothetical protein
MIYNASASMTPYEDRSIDKKDRLKIILIWAE